MSASVKIPEQTLVATANAANDTAIPKYDSVLETSGSCRVS
jgi:hypothetical protein